MKAISFIKTFFTTFFLFLVLVVGTLVYISSRGDFYGWRVLIVKSGSMEPVIKTGSLIFTKTQSEYVPDDIVTFGSPNSADTLITHRLIAVEEEADGKFIRTKGDFNQIEDKERSLYNSIVGKYQFGIPLVGYVIDFAKTPQGVVLLVIIPGTIIIYEELQNIRKHAVAMLTTKKSKPVERENEVDQT
jgi:signal peptidase